MKKAKRFFLFILLILQCILTIPSFATNIENEDNLTIYCPSCILMETSTGKILYEKNANEIRYPASTTKIMTAILTLENCELTDKAIVSHDAIFTVPVRIFSR